ncbi:MAG: 50S ribosomal protein L29 [Myxococcota bacterium]
MDTQELRELNDERLADLDKSIRRLIFDARLKNFTDQLDDTASIRRARRDLARVKTIRRERIIAASTADSSAEKEQTDD